MPSANPYRKGYTNRPPREKGVSIFRPFVYGSIATPLSNDPAQRPPGTAPDHTHQWTVFVRGVDGAEITYWLKKVQFKLHETYSQSLRTVEAPDKFEVTETGWGEFEVAIKFFFVPESNEKPQSIYHQLKLHPYGPDAEAAKERGDTVVSQLYNEVVFNEPTEAFYEILTTPAPSNTRGKGAAKQAKQKRNGDRSAEIPAVENADNPYSMRAEEKELDLLTEAQKRVDAILNADKVKLAEREEELRQLREELGLA